MKIVYIKNKKNIAEILYKMKENDDNNIFILNFIKNGNGNLTNFSIIHINL